MDIDERRAEAIVVAGAGVVGCAAEVADEVEAFAEQAADPPKHRGVGPLEARGPRQEDGQITLRGAQTVGSGSGAVASNTSSA